MYYDEAFINVSFIALYHGIVVDLNFNMGTFLKKWSEVLKEIVKSYMYENFNEDYKFFCV